MDQLSGAPGEGDIGLEVFITPTPGIGGRARKSPEDFVVEEVSRYPERQDDGRFVIATVTSTNWETNRLVRQLSKALRISRSKVGFAGTKDKRAVTTQLLSFEAPLEDVTGLRLHQVVISNAYRARKPMTIGDLVGNRFRVTVRDCNLRDEGLETVARGTATALEELGGFPNFFGVQRFGVLRPVTHVVGRHIVRGEFEKAVMAYVGNPMQAEGDDSREARRILDETRDFAGALVSYPKKLTFERTVIAHMAKNPGDYSGAIGALPPNLQMMFTHAYQSYLFNKVLSQRIRVGLPLDRPVVGDVVLPTDRTGLIDHEIAHPQRAQRPAARYLLRGFVPKGEVRLGIRRSQQSTLQLHETAGRQHPTIGPVQAVGPEYHPHVGRHQTLQPGEAQLALHLGPGHVGGESGTQRGLIRQVVLFAGQRQHPEGTIPR